MWFVLWWSRVFYVIFSVIGGMLKGGFLIIILGLCLNKCVVLFGKVVISFCFFVIWSVVW